MAGVQHHLGTRAISMTAIGTATQDSATCPHGKRAGITVCLYCRQEARQAARRRRNQMLMRVGGLLAAGVVVVGVIAAALIAVAPWSRTSAPQAAEAAAPARTGKLASTPTVAVVAKPVAARTAQMSPVVAEGLTDLGDSVFVERSGGEVTVRFDNSMLRTRFEEKFERTVRSTLPRVYGTPAQVALDSVVPGTLVRGDLLNELPAKGIELTVGPGRALMVFPVTRQGENGPLVVAYRAVPRG